VVFNTYLVFSINTMSVSSFRVSCVSSNCLCAVRTCRARRRHVIRVSDSRVIRASRAYYFMRRQRAMSCVPARRLHVVVLFHVS
jgi:hypothetical protein